jgi:hypothetical protein
MSCQFQPLRLQVKQVYKGYASACNVKPFTKLVEAHITRENGGSFLSKGELNVVRVCR